MSQILFGGHQFTKVLVESGNRFCRNLVVAKRYLDLFKVSLSLFFSFSACLFRSIFVFLSFQAQKIDTFDVMEVCSYIEEEERFLKSIDAGHKDSAFKGHITRETKKQKRDKETKKQISLLMYVQCKLKHIYHL